MATEKLTLDNGKYTIVNGLGEGKGFKALRYGEEWRNLAGDNLVLSLFQEVMELQESNARYERLLGIKQAEGKTTFKVNANMHVRVKLTERGIDILKHNHVELNKLIHANGGTGLGEFELRLDEDGYYKTQIWMLMKDFGHAMSMGSREPFLLDLIIENGTIMEESEK